VVPRECYAKHTHGMEILYGATQIEGFPPFGSESNVPSSISSIK
jgi:hypothetical protein